MKFSDVKDVKEIPLLLADQEGFESVVDELKGMFDREIFDCIVSSGHFGHVAAGIMAAKINGGILCVDDDGSFDKEALKAGWKVILIADTLESGEKELDLINRIESCGCKVIRVGFISEQTSFGARKSRILKKYPFEAVITL